MKVTAAAAASSTKAAEITELRPVLPPASRLTAERENERTPEKTAKRCRRCWIALTDQLPVGIDALPDLCRDALAMEIASMNPTIEITKAVVSSAPNASRSILRRPRLGNSRGMLSTTSPPLTSLMRQR